MTSTSIASPHAPRPAPRVPVPALLNRASGSAARAHAALRSDSRFDVRQLQPADIGDAVRAEAMIGTPRLLVCGGDGTLCTALAAAAGTALEIAILPGGTLNHFAHDLGLPCDDPVAALDIAVNGTAKPVDLGYVNGHAILNTSAVGGYVDFVRYRERLEQRLSYRAASVAAAISVWHEPRVLAVELETADGGQRQVHTPLLFVGMHERVLHGAALGKRRRDGARALHILLVRDHTRLRLHALVFRAIVSGLRGLMSEHEIATRLTRHLVVTTSTPKAEVAIDGELLQLESPLRYEFVPDAVRVVHP
jgi:diacylglycerol kinase family enzyme